MAEEDKVLATVRRYLKSQGIFHMRCNPSNGIGMPDLIACVDGRFVGIEVKYSRNGAYGVTKAQVKRLEAIIASGGCGMVIGMEDLESLGEELRCGTKRFGF